jgi:anhydro-N-acetylmuramic acid kinase
MKIIGLMSGTSCDGVDAALCEIEDAGAKRKVEAIAWRTDPYPSWLQQRLLAACQEGGASARGITALHAHLGEVFANAALAVAEQAGIPISEVDAIASHGHTLWHQPTPDNLPGWTEVHATARGTLQIGCPAVIAERTGCTVVSDFRSADMAAGGQGAPLVPFADWMLLSSPDESRAVQNIGGIANVTYLPKGGSLEDVIAFDTGPGNAVIDEAAVFGRHDGPRYDVDGAIAAKGEVIPALLGELLSHLYFLQSPPKSTGRETFGSQYFAEVFSSWIQRHGVESFRDTSYFVATFTAFTAETIARAYREWLGPVDTVILGGGGAKNPTLVRMIQERVAPARVTTHEEFGIPSDAKEAIAFALLGYETLNGRPSNVPSATGASKAVVLGSITPSARRIHF